ncbi:hypothetical protein [Sutterella sp.]|uniref:hypothetical protein n=1 Tax=Sutterella sp. TaxID=1981025 RepID=UPI0026DEC013|nr:hypothetical protein [Sutterella sp.]MDO5532099.1 hypothetical protein [Sutterella sp.]
MSRNTSSKNGGTNARAGQRNGGGRGGRQSPRSRSEERNMRPGLELLYTIALERGILSDLTEALGDAKLAESVLGLAGICLAAGDVLREDDPEAEFRRTFRENYGRDTTAARIVEELAGRMKAADFEENYAELRASRLSGSFVYQAYANLAESDEDFNKHAGLNLGIVMEKGFAKDCVLAVPHPLGTAIRSDDVLLSTSAALRAPLRFLLGEFNYDSGRGKERPVLAAAEAAGFTAFRHLLSVDPGTRLHRFIEKHFGECILPRVYIPEFKTFAVRVPGEAEGGEEGRVQYILLPKDAYIGTIEFLSDQIQELRAAYRAGMGRFGSRAERLEPDLDLFDVHSRVTACSCIAGTAEIPPCELARMNFQGMEFSDIFTRFWDALTTLLPAEWQEEMPPEAREALRRAGAFMGGIVLSLVFATGALLRDVPRAYPGTVEMLEEIDPIGVAGEWLSGTPHQAFEFLESLPLLAWGWKDGARVVRALLPYSGRPLGETFLRVWNVNLSRRHGLTFAELRRQYPCTPRITRNRF